MSSVIKISEAEFERELKHYQDVALTEPVAVTRNGRERTVTMSIEEYRRLKRSERRVMRLEDFTEDDIAEIEAARAPESAKAFDDEVEPAK